MYVADGRFTAQRPSRFDGRIDLAGRFIVPPYGDAHTHGFGDQKTIGSANAVHLRHGVFYWNALLHSHKAECDSYFVIDQPDDIARQWRAIMADRPNVVTIFLLDTENYASMRADTARLGATGLDPSPVPAIVAAAHRSGRRVAAHIESAADFHVAVAAGVDMVAHLPGFALTSAVDSVRAVIAPADAQLAAQRGLAVIPTAWHATQRRISRGDTARIERTLRVECQDLATLRRFGVRLAAEGTVSVQRAARFER